MEEKSFLKLRNCARSWTNLTTRKRIQFFATKQDLLSVLGSVEATHSLKYARAGHYTEESYETYEFASLIPGLGTATSDSAISCHSFLVVRRGTPVSSRRIETRQGVAYAVDQLLNSESAILRPGGLWGDVLLHGELAAAHDCAFYRELKKSIRFEMKKHFRTIEHYSVGPAALEILKAGGRLTIAVQSPPEYDLPLPAKE